MTHSTNQFSINEALIKLDENERRQLDQDINTLMFDAIVYSSCPIPADLSWLDNLKF